MSGFGLALSIVVFIGAPMIIRIVLGSEFEPSITVLRILAGLPMFVCASNVLVIQIMVPFGKDKAFTIILISAGILNIILAILFTSIWLEFGMALAVLLSELFVTVTMLIYLSFNHLNPVIRQISFGDVAKSSLMEEIN